jgi:hypothetical protein
VRGDYQSAVRILRPLAEDNPQPDALAQFFMAMLYESGDGAARDSLRACGLYLSAATAANPLMNQSLDLARELQEQYSGKAAAFCEAASISPSRPRPPRTFALAPDHWVTIDETGTTVGYMGAEKRTHGGGAAGLVALPRHTPMDVTRPVEARRHFIQSFLWLPSPATDPPTWTLGWMLAEIVGLDYVPVTGERELASITAPRPPAVFDLAGLARIGVNANGEAEWAISGGANPRSGIIPFRAPR